MCLRVHTCSGTRSGKDITSVTTHMFLDFKLKKEAVKVREEAGHWITKCSLGLRYYTRWSFYPKEMTRGPQDLVTLQEVQHGAPETWTINPVAALTFWACDYENTIFLSVSTSSSENSQNCLFGLLGSSLRAQI